MRLSKRRETELLEQLRADPATCITFPPEVYSRADGGLLVHRDYLQEMLHRRLYRLLIDPSLGRRYLTRVCESFGCVNPYHYRPVADRSVSDRPACPSGHLYLPGNLTATGQCRACWERRRSRDRSVLATANAAKTTCPAGHEYTPENTYSYRAPGGGTQRKCRACTAARNAARPRRRSGKAMIVSDDTKGAP